jgi:hypothetical protein
MCVHSHKNFQDQIQNTYGETQKNKLMCEWYHLFFCLFDIILVGFVFYLSMCVLNLFPKILGIVKPHLMNINLFFDYLE